MFKKFEFPDKHQRYILEDPVLDISEPPFNKDIFDEDDALARTKEYLQTDSVELAEKYLSASAVCARLWPKSGQSADCTWCKLDNAPQRLEKIKATLRHRHRENLVDVKDITSPATKKLEEITDYYLAELLKLTYSYRQIVNATGYSNSLAYRRKLASMEIFPKMKEINCYLQNSVDAKLKPAGNRSVFDVKLSYCDQYLNSSVNDLNYHLQVLSNQLEIIQALEKNPLGSPAVAEIAENEEYTLINW